jgi:hypothetical protein
MILEFSQFFLNIKKDIIVYKDFNKLIESLDDIVFDSIKTEISLKCISNEEYFLDIIKKDNRIQDIIMFIYYIIHCYLLDYKDLELNSKTEMNIKNNNNIKYYVFKTDTEDKLNIFRLFLRIFYLVDPSPTNYLGIDFEFNTKVAALIQLCFEGFKLIDDNTTYSFIFIFDPNQLVESDRYCLIHKYLINDKYYKLLHGAESLDLPYLFSTIFKNNKKHIIKFTQLYIDTRYLCEYYNQEQNKKDNKCKIYHALLNTGVINKTQFDKLKENETKMGHIYDINININNINNELLKYTLYDVLFLKQFFFKFIYRPDNTKNKIYISVIPELTQFILLEKREIIQIFSKFKVNIDRTNNNYTFIKGKFYKLIDIFKKIKDNIKLMKINITYLLNINFYRTFLFYLIKLICYNQVIQVNKVYLSKNATKTKIMDIDDVIKKINTLGFNNISILVKNIENFIKVNVLKLLNS